jgi:predicted Zn finger-like uncharacterized protein
VYTQCSKCETVFKLSAEVLRAASGQVRCGRCGEVFNALARLAEDSNAFTAGESQLELEARADRILETVGAMQVAQEMAKDAEEFAPPGIEIAQLEVLDWNDEDPQEQPDSPANDAGAEDGEHGDDAASADRAMEFTLPPGELDRIFVETKKRALVPPRASPGGPQLVSVPTPAPAPQSVAAAAAAPAVSAQSQPKSAAELRSDTERRSDSELDAGRESDSELPRHPESAGAHALPLRNRVSGFEVPEDVRRDMLEGIEEHLDPAILLLESERSRQPLPRRPLILWLSAAIVSALLLAAQVVHQNREWLIAHGPFGAAVRALYGALGNPLPQPANLSAYQLRQWGVTGDPDANGTLRVRASILNTAAQLQPYPLLRVTLANRFGTGIGARDFEPAEYLGKPTARLLAPGERVDATLEILDPGKNAEGFEIDVCLRGADHRISCANDAPTQTKR